MRYNPTTLEEAFKIASRLDRETSNGSLGISTCPRHSVNVFAVDGYALDGVTAYGYCFNPACGYERSVDEAENAAFEDHVFKRG